MASYKIIIENKAEKELRKLAKPVRQRLASAIDGLAGNPRPAASRKMVGSTGFRLRIGDYRVIYEIDDAIVTIYIVKVGHRREVYKK